MTHPSVRAPKPNRPTVHMTRGLPASGKSTWAKALVEQAPKGSMLRINKDDLRAMTHGFWSKQTEPSIVRGRDALLASALTQGIDVVIDDTNLALTHVKTVAAIAWEHGADFELHDFFDVSVEECIRRDAGRGDASVGEKVIRSMAKNQLPAARSYRHRTVPHVAPVVPTPGLPSAILMDMDGTAALMNGRGPFDWDKVGEDLPNPAVVGLAKVLVATGANVIAFSARPEQCRAQTAAWLAEHVGAGIELFMRRDNDMRRDSYVKAEMFETHIRGRFNIDFVLDDRDRVVNLWRTMGLSAFQVAPGAF